MLLVIKEMTADKAIQKIRHYGGVVLKTSLADAKEQALRHALASAVESKNATPKGGANLTDSPERQDIKAAASPP